MQFRTPTQTLPVTSINRDRLWGRVHYQQGYALVKFTNGTYTQMNYVDQEMADVAFVYVGGHIYSVDDTEAAALTAAGYGSYLEEES